MSKSRITAHRKWWDVVQPGLDAASIMASLAATKLATRGWIDDTALAMGLVTCLVFLLISQITGLSRRFEAGSIDNELKSVIATWAGTVMVLALLAFITRYGEVFARSVMAIWIIVAPSMIAMSRMCLRIIQGVLLRRGVGVRRVAIAGLNGLGRQTAANIVADESLGFRFAGFFDDRNEERDKPSTDTPEVDTTLKGKLADLVQQARDGQIDTILITLPMRAEERIKFMLGELSDTTASVYIVPDFFVFELLHSRWTSMGGLPAVSVFENPLYGVDGLSKRTADLLIAFVGLIMVSIPMLLIAIAVKLSSRGPVFFRQKRYGLDGKEIMVWKFRSMRTCDNGPVVKQATKADPRITKIGGILRKTSLDELPQLFNVIEGTMSLVGPRPHASAHNEQYRNLIDGYMLRHKVKPGITGLAQVNGCRGETETVDKMERRIEWDHKYIRNWSLWMDIKILFKTFAVVWKQEEAY